MKYSLSSLLLMSLSAVVPAAPPMMQGGQIPVQESVCDPLKAEDVTKGLYGMCVAFCEGGGFASHDVPLTEAEFDALAQAAPSGAILRNYNRKKQASDPDMPCIVLAEDEPCLCWTSQELLEVSDGVSAEYVGIRYGCDVTSTSMQVSEGESTDSFAALFTTRSGSANCYYSNSATGKQLAITLETEDQAAACRKQLAERCSQIK
jgi:hypothetical protein